MVEVLTVGFLLNFIQILDKVRVSVWEAMSEIYTVVIIVKRVSERKSVVPFVWEPIALHVVTNLVLVVADVGANSVPAHLFGLKVLAAV